MEIDIKQLKCKREYVEDEPNVNVHGFDGYIEEGEFSGKFDKDIENEDDIESYLLDVLECSPKDLCWNIDLKKGDWFKGVYVVTKNEYGEDR